MHKYLKKLVDQGWLDTNGKLVNYYTTKTNLQIKRHLLFKKGRKGIEKHIVKLTSFLPKEFSLKYRLKILRWEFTPEELVCPVCGGWRKMWTSSLDRNKIFNSTCGLQDEEHKKFIRNNRVKTRIETCNRKYGVDHTSQIPETRIKARQTCIENYGFDNPSKVPEIKLKKIETNIKRYGSIHANQSHLNKENYQKLSKKFIEDNFLDKNGCLLISKFQKFLGSKKVAVFNTCKYFGVKPTIKSGFDPNQIAIVYYIKDVTTNLYKIGITNGNVELRFGTTKMKEIEVLQILSFENGENAYLVEQALHNHFKGYQIDNENFKDVGGYTEFFDRDVLNRDKEKNEND